jgi:endonuclease/exonuclease/phosphatase family metal-dependent hydrolase
MNLFLKGIVVCAVSLLAVCYAIASFSFIIAPSSFSFIALFSLVFPYLFMLQLAVTIVMFFIHKKWAFFFMFLLALGSYNLAHTIAFHFPSSFQLKKNKKALRIMTWNVAYFINTFPAKEPMAQPRLQMLRLIDSLQPDVLCFQEYRNIQGSKIHASVQKELDSLGYHYSAVTTDRVGFLNKTKTAVAVEGSAIFSKLPLYNIQQQVIHYDEEKAEHLLFADILFEQKPLRIFTTHFTSFFIYIDTVQEHRAGKDIYEITYNRRRKVQSRLRLTEAEHEKQVHLVKQQFRNSKHPFVFCADLNTVPASSNYHTLKRGLQDVFLKKGSGIGSTFYKIAPTLRIDVCLADKLFRVQQCAVIQKPFSDHYPLVADLEWKQ